MQRLLIFLTFFLSVSGRDKRALQKSHEKSQLEKWEDKFLRRAQQFDQTDSLVNLINKIAFEELFGCTTVILYDIFTESSGDRLLEKLFRKFPLPYVHGQITEEYVIKVPKLLSNQDTCISYVLFLKDVMRCKSIIGTQSNAKVVLVARSSQWRVYEFLASEESQNFLNILVIAMSEKIVLENIELPYILYTHKLYIDALGSSLHQVITSWRNGTYSKPSVLFPKKISTGFAGHRFIISLAHQAPFVIKKGRNENNDLEWDGSEIRLVNLLAKMFNFTTDYREATNSFILGSSEAVTTAIKTNKANLGISGLYITNEIIQEVDTSHLHTQDCAAFISLTSTALPKFRAIMGPFHWGVWLALTLVYLFAILPLVFSHQHSFKSLIEKPQEIENMFWYVFGTFTNAFTFLGKNSWSRTDKFATRLLIGFYWIFTIIITACYTGSIIAFVTLPVFPETVDTPEQLIKGRFQIGTLAKGGWPHWFENATDPVSVKLLKNIDLVPDVQSGFKNITKAFFWPYAFLGSRAELDYVLRTNFTTTNKRTLLYISSQCFSHFGVGIIYNKNSLYSKIIDVGLLRVVESGIMIKIKKDVQWDLYRSAGGKLLAAGSFGKSLKDLSVEDRALTLDDIQGMFLLLAIGFVMGGVSLLTEWMGGCLHLCKGKKPISSIESRRRSYDAPTPREKLNSIESNCVVHKEEPEDDIEEYINRLFDFEYVFGDENIIGNETQEELSTDLDEINEANSPTKY